MKVKVKTGVLFPKYEKPLRSSVWEEIMIYFFNSFVSKIIHHKTKKIKLDLIKNVLIKDTIKNMTTQALDWEKDWQSYV